MTTVAGSHLFTTRSGRRVHLAACWCWRPPAGEELDYPETMQAAGLASVRGRDGKLQPPATVPAPPVLVDVALSWRRWRRRP